MPTSSLHHPAAARVGLRLPAAAPLLVALGLGLLHTLTPHRAEARAGGIASSGCEGCHGPPGNASLTMTASPATFNPGDRVELTLSIIGGFANGGVYVNSGDLGNLEAIANQGLTKVSSGLVHNQPKPGSGGTVQFRFAWVAPATPGGVRFNVYALGGNGNLRSSGDAGIDGMFDFVYGCSGKLYYLDGDSDGFGRENFTMLGCDDNPPPSYSAVAGDCDDYRNTTYPGAPELCNMRDDDCDGEIDEDALPVEMWPDADGDGFYDARTEKVGEPRIGCVGLKGWAAYPGDCRPEDKLIHPDAEEVCDYVDNDCDGDVDERVRPTCGEGWCRREAPGCDMQYCVPGEPVPEKCNFLDDDCDGEIDEDPDLCPAGQTCAAGQCVDSDTVMLDPMGVPNGSGNTGNGSGNSGNNNGSGNNGSTNGGSSGAMSSKDGASGCALGSRAGHGALVVLGMLTAGALLRRRRGAAA